MTNSKQRQKLNKDIFNAAVESWVNLIFIHLRVKNDNLNNKVRLRGEVKKTNAEVCKTNYHAS